MDASKGHTYTTISMAVAIALLSMVGSTLPAHGSDSDPPAYAKGYVPPAFGRPSIEAKMPETAALALPIRFDWREQGMVTPIKNQGACGACYAFASLADFESQLLLSGEGLFDFSENNVKECEWHGSRCIGGNYWRVANLLSARGTVMESCDQYAAHPQYNCKETCPYVKTLLDWRVISYEETPDPEVLKSYIHSHGPVFTAIYAGSGDAWSSELSSYDGSYTLYYGGSNQVNHAVLIIGWDDTLSHVDGEGAWIVKNSWGTGWGGTCGYGTERGYFQIAYGSANIGHLSSFLYDWQDYDPNGALLYYDEAGYTVEEGYPGSATAWGLCEYVPTGNGAIERVEFFSVDEVTDVDVYIYDDFAAGSLSNLLGSQLNTSFEHPGYHSIELTPPVGIDAEDAIYVVAKITNATYAKPLPADDLGSLETGKCYKSPNGNTWYQVLDRDLGIRARVAWDSAAPESPSSFDAVGSDTAVTLSWVNPGDADFSHTLIVYSNTNYPATPSGGIPVENGADGKFYNSPASSDNFVHTGLNNDVTYYYSAFAGDIVPNYSARSVASATPEDSVPPASVTGFSAIASDRSVKLRWTNPDDSDLTGVVVAYSTEEPLSSPLGGYPVENGNDGVFLATPAAVDSFIHTGLWNDTTYYYCIAAFDEMTNYSISATETAMPQDLLPPDLSISVLQNPYITNHLDIYISSSEAIFDTSFVVTVGGDELEPLVVPGEVNVFRCDYNLYYSGIISIEACARDTNFNWGRSVSSFGASRIVGGSGGSAMSADGCLEVAIPGGTVTGDMYVVILDAPASLESLISAYEVSPASQQLDGMVSISIAYDHDMGDPQHLCIAGAEGNRLHPLESYVDRERRRVIAHADRFGTYGLYRDENIFSKDYGSGELRLLQNVPNPFQATTSIAYEVPKPTWLRLDVVSVEGRLVTTLWEGVAIAGAHEILWDGTDQAGHKVASGVYHYTVTTDAGTTTRKMVLLH